MVDYIEWLTIAYKKKNWQYEWQIELRYNLIHIDCSRDLLKNRRQFFSHLCSNCFIHITLFLGERKEEKKKTDNIIFHIYALPFFYPIAICYKKIIFGQHININKNTRQTTLFFGHMRNLHLWWHLAEHVFRGFIFL